MGRLGNRRRGWALVVAVLALLAIPSAAGAATTITLGPTNLGAATVSGRICRVADACTTLTEVPTVTPGAQVFSPTDGTITSWRVKGTVNGTGSFELRVVHPAGSG